MGLNHSEISHEIRTKCLVVFCANSLHCLLLFAACPNFRCANGVCKSTAVRCNNTNECGDGSDEVGCGEMQSRFLVVSWDS